MTDQEHLWERRVITKLAQASLKEQKRARRWSIFFKFLVFAYITFILFIYAEPDITSTKISQTHMMRHTISSGALPANIRNDDFL